MGQGIIAGATSYEEQSLKDILSDIEYWINYTTDIIFFIEESISKLRECKFWEEIPFNFQMTILASVVCQQTYIEDFNLIKKSIKENLITEREVKLLYGIGNKAREFNRDYGITYKEDFHWKKYGQTDFIIAENIYAKGRDYFATLQDAANASYRLNDYVSQIPSITNNNVTQHITGSMNLVNGINYGNITNNSTNECNFFQDCDLAISKIYGSNEIENEIKEYIENLLNKSKRAMVENNDIEKDECKTDFKGFILGAGVKAYKVLGILSNFASIASFFGITI